MDNTELTNVEVRDVFVTLPDTGDAYQNGVALRRIIESKPKGANLTITLPKGVFVGMGTGSITLPPLGDSRGLVTIRSGE